MKLIFDMDGTLADTAKATVPSIAEMCEKKGWKAPAEKEVRAAIGTAKPEFYYRLFPDQTKEQVYALGQEVEAAEEKWVRKIGPEILFPGVYQMLEDIAAVGIPMHMASTGDQAHVNVVLESAQIKHFFQSIHCHEPGKAGMVARMIGQAWWRV